MADEIWNIKNYEKVFFIAKDAPHTLIDRLKKFLKDLFFKLKPNGDNDGDQAKLSIDSFNEDDFQKLLDFKELMIKFSSNSKCSSFINQSIELIVGHSIIRELFLNPCYFGTKIRLELIVLFVSLCSESIKHCFQIEGLIELIFSSYQATLFLEDQYLYQLICLFETNGFNEWDKYNPNIWGQNAAMFHAAKHSQKLKFLRTPNIDEIFKGFKTSKYLLNALDRFPIDVFKNDEPKKIIDFQDPDECCRFDPRYMMSMFEYLLKNRPLKGYHKFISYGCFSYTIAGLSSQCINVRRLAYYVLFHYYQHLECANYPQDRQLWIGFINYIRSGLTEEWQRIDSVHTLLFVKIVEILNDPTCKLFPTIRNFLISQQLKPYNYKSVPNLYKYCLENISGEDQSSYKLHQEFVFNWILKSSRTASDINLWNKYRVYNNLLIYCNSPLCDEKNVMLIYLILVQLSKSIDGIKVLFNDCSILSWINHQLTIFPQYQLSTINKVRITQLREIMLNICNLMYCSQKKQESESIPQFLSHQWEIHLILSKLMYKLPKEDLQMEQYFNIAQEAFYKPTELTSEPKEPRTGGRKKRKLCEESKYDELRERLLMRQIICFNLPENLNQ